MLLAFLPAMARADRIHLENGNVFDDVVLVSETPVKVRFLVGSGEMSLPASWIERIERAPGALEEYLLRSRDLAEQEQPQAEQYLALARWARLQGLRHAFRDSLLTAAELEPDLEGLPPLMASVDYTLDSAGGFWAPKPRPAVRAEVGHEPRNSVEDHGSASQSTGQPRPDVEIAAGLTRAIETLAQAELERSRAPRPSRTARVERHVYPLVRTAAFSFVSNGWVFPGVPLRGPDSDPSNPVIRKPANPAARALLARPPGSLLPVSAYQ